MMNFGSLARLGLLIVFLSSAFAVARAADSPDDRYVSIYSTVTEADGLNAEGKRAEALKKYTQAQAALFDLKRSNPTWNTKVVTFRLNELASKIATLTQPEVAPGSSNQPPVAVARPSRADGPVRLLAAGAEPRTVLRFHPQVGQTQTVVLTLRIAQETLMPGVTGQPSKTPPIQMTIETSIKNVAENGDISFETVMKGMTTLDEPGVAPEMVAAVRKALEGVNDSAVSGVVSSRGITRNSAAKTMAKNNPISQQVMGQMQELMGNMATELPNEAVGVGARWENRKQVKSQGMTLNQVTTQEVVSINENQVVLTGTITQSGANQKVQNPAMSSVKLDLTKMSASGTDSTTLDLTQLFPTAGKAKMTSEASMSVNTAGGRQSMTLKTQMEMELKQK